MRRLTKGRLFSAAAASVLALPALAQVGPAAPKAVPAAPAQPQVNSVAPTPAQPAPSAAPQAQALSEGDTNPDEASAAEQQVKAPPPVEYPSFARRDPATAGAVNPVSVGLPGNLWGAASGPFLSTLMRRMDTPIASRWLHIAMRDALISRADAPRNVNPVDWAAERAWLLLRMGEADGARLLVASVDSDRFTPKMVQVAVQTSLASSDPTGLCAVSGQMQKVEQTAYPLVQAICAALGGQPEAAAADIDSARRRGPAGGIDLALAQKIVGAAAETGRAVTIEWEPVQSLNTWRYGLSTASGMSPPDRLMKDAPLQLRAWYAQAPLIAFSDRLESARIAAALGVFSSQSLLDFYSQVYDSTDPNDLGASEAWQVRLAFAGRDRDTRLAAMRHLWSLGSGSLDKEASRALLAAAAARVAPDEDLQSDAPNLIASMLAGGLDREAQRWMSAVGSMDDQYADQCWAMLALAAPGRPDLGRLNGFIDRDSSANRKRSQLLVAGLVGLGRMDAAAASRLNNRYGLTIGRTSNWSAMIDAAAARRQAGTILVLAGTGFQAASWKDVPSAHLFHAVAALRKSGQEFTARMIAAEALART
jgi:hypothetical protein